ncbi:uncharacterized protein LOC6615212 [Drosophila sechellia]|uniref:GM23071 n=1 Tax=Drosophila sechellia TaxID=7238 RepID=B4I6F6_DROSE|nr:uncharacterized protein LOC6615212 [Drosophila sechellia]EDW56362.1 GM23071 [Drosophila sechellia]
MPSRKIKLTSSQLKYMDLIMAHMCRGKFTKASRLMDMVSRSKHKFAPIHEAILRKMLKLMIDPNYGKRRSRRSIETDNQPNFEEIGIARMETTPQTLYKEKMRPFHQHFQMVQPGPTEEITIGLLALYAVIIFLGILLETDLF